MPCLFGKVPIWVSLSFIAMGLPILEYSPEVQTLCIRSLTAFLRIFETPVATVR